MPSKTLLMFPAVREDAIEVDETDFEDEPTSPRQSIPERTTERPSAEDLTALVEASRDAPTWLGEPRWAIAPDTGELVLVESYRGRQRDQYGNTFLVDVPAGLRLAAPATAAQARAIRSALIVAAMRVLTQVRIVPSTSNGELWCVLDDQWRVEIVTAFAEGDAGVRQRG